MTANGTNLNNFRPSGELRDLCLLEELEKNPVISQRELSHKFGIALGVTNACLKRMVRKGWIRIRDLNPRKIGYFLTSKGLLEKGRLTLNLITYRIQNYSELKNIIGDRLLEMHNKGLTRLVFYGISDEMEVAYVTLQGVNMKLVGIVEDDEKFTPQILFGHEVEPVSRIKELKPDCVLITSLEKREEKKQRIRKFLNGEDVYVYDISVK